MLSILFYIDLKEMICMARKFKSDAQRKAVMSRLRHDKSVTVSATVPKGWKQLHKSDAKVSIFDYETYMSPKRIIRIMEPKRYHKERGFPYLVEYETPEQYVTEYFKTRPEARQFVLNFMETHPKG